MFVALPMDLSNLLICNAFELELNTMSNHNIFYVHFFLAFILLFQLIFASLLAVNSTLHSMSKYRMNSLKL